MHKSTKHIETYLTSCNIRTFEYSQIKKIINKSEPIGRGAHALVYIASLEGKTYAVKSFNNNVFIDVSALKRFKRELKILYDVDHPNVVKFYRISRDVESGNFMLLLQYANGGSLRDYLRTKQQNGSYKILWDELIRIAMEITRGLDHLHSMNIIHRDLHSMNVLINEGRALIADFGLSKKLDDLTSTSSSGVKGLSAYIDPQHFYQQKLGKNFESDKKSDIYSLGVLLWELTSGIPPFRKYPDLVICLILIGKRERPIIGTPLDYTNLYTKCWSSEPDQRPTLEVILTEIEKLSKEKTDRLITNVIDNDEHTKPKISTSFMESEFIANVINDHKQSKPETSTHSMSFSSNNNNNSLESDLCIFKEINNLQSAIPDEIKQSKPETSTHSIDFSLNDNRKSLEKTNYLQYAITDEIMINIFKFVKFPFNLTTSCRQWYHISKNSLTRAEWIIFQFGKAHCLFHAIKLGPTFIDVPVARAIIANGGIISRYFMQRLFFYFFDLKIPHSAGQTDIDRTKLQQKIIPWASNLPYPVYSFLQTEAYNQFKSDLHWKGNDFELFHFLSGGPYQIEGARIILEKNRDKINDLILRFKFIPFPPRRRSHTQTNLPEEYPTKDGHENNRQFNVIARAILLYKDLVNLWKKIGYYEICEDINHLVIQGALLILFPPNRPPGWIKPNILSVKARLTELIELGFQLNYGIIIDVFHLFEDRLDDIGEILIESFANIMQEPLDCLLYNCLIELLGPTIKIKSFNVINFLYKYLPDNPEKVFKMHFTSI